MPNILAHAYVSNEVKGFKEPDINLGSLLPDFKGMFADFHEERVRIKGWHQHLDEGIRFHEQTDTVFNAHPEVPQITTALTQDLIGVGVGESAARLSAHFLADVMLDGALIAYERPRGAYHRLANFVMREETAIDGDVFPDAFINSVRQYLNRGLPMHYRDAGRLASIAQERLRRRAEAKEKPWNMFHEDLTEQVGEVIDANKNIVATLGVTALEKTIEILKIAEVNSTLF